EVREAARSGAVRGAGDRDPDGGGQRHRPGREDQRLRGQAERAGLSRAIDGRGAGPGGLALSLSTFMVLPLMPRLVNVVRLLCAYYLRAIQEPSREDCGMTQKVERWRGVASAALGLSVMLAAGPASATHDEPGRGKALRTALVTAYKQCTN